MDKLQEYGVKSGQARTHSVLHVVARKKDNTPIYYHRQWIDQYRWTAWTKIDLDIVSDHVLPIVWNRRLYLFWAVINRKPNKTQEKPVLGLSNSKPPDVKTHLEIQLEWSEFKGQKWLPKKTAPQTIVLKDPNDNTGNAIEPFTVTLRTTTFDYPLLRIDLFANLDHCAEFVLGGAGNTVEAFVLETVYTTGLEEIGPETHNIGKLVGRKLSSLFPPPQSYYEAMAIVPSSCNYGDQPDRQRVSTCYTMYSDADGGLQPASVLNKADFYRLLVPHQIKDFDSSLPFFYEDSLRSYFVIPTQGDDSSSLSQQPQVGVWYKFIPFYHAFVPLFIRELNRGGVDALFKRILQLDPATVPPVTIPFDSNAFEAYYQPNKYERDSSDHVTVDTYPSEGVDFEQNDGYAIYNWELFFHAPFQIGESLSFNQRFEDAKHWYEYIFNPSSTPFNPTSGTIDEVPKRYWVTKPFHNMENYEIQIKRLMELINQGDQDTKNKAEEWRNNPFDPHVIAQSRQVAYERTIVMKYIDNLIAWGDQLFSQDTTESINEATQMYVLAAELLGPQPELVKPLVVPSDKTYEELEKDLDDFANASVLAAENLLGPVQGSGSVDPNKPKLPLLPTLYFSIPPNDQLLGYWDKVANRLFKIRHGMNIKGVKRQLALFAPPIDPGLLVKAAAAGLDIGSILSDTSAALPPYRFRVMVREAIEFCEMVRGFGNELLGALEKSDAEALAIERSGHEKKLQEQIRTVMQRKLDEATQQIDVLSKQRQIIVDRQLFYSQRKDKLTNEYETTALANHSLSLELDKKAMDLEIQMSKINMLPNAQFGGSGAGGSPHVTVVWGSSNVASSMSSMSSAIRISSAILQSGANISQTIASYQRRKDDWELQYNLATDELTANDSQSLAAAIRQDIAQKELDNHDTNVDLATKVDEFLHDKYTNKDLYDWMISQTSATYFQAYQLAYTLAKRAEQCFKHELGLSDSQASYIQFGYWNSLKKGLLAGDKLLFDLQRLKSAYYAQNARELELTKHISLLALDPYALVELRSKGECMIKLPEILFDLENPGHYMRRIKSVGITVPCVVGPYTCVSMTLTLHDNHVRISSDSNDYAFYPDKNNLNRFVDDQGGASAIVTSSAQNDRGMFELRLDDERYLPFECAGAISSWKLQLNPVYPQFDYSTISDVIVHLQYTARDGGEELKNKASEAVKNKLKDFALAENRSGLYLLISSRHEFGSNWQKFLNPDSGKSKMLTVDISPDRFPFFTSGLDITIKGIDFVAKLSDSYTIAVTPPGGNVNIGTMVKDLGYLHHCCIDGSSKSRLGQIDLGSTLAPKQNLTWSFQFQKNSNPVKLSASDIDDLLLVIHYEVKEPQKS